MVILTPQQFFALLLQRLVPWQVQEEAALLTKVQQLSQAHDPIADYFK